MRTVGKGAGVVVLAFVFCFWSGDSKAAARRAATPTQPIPNLAAYWPLDTDASDVSGTSPPNNGTLNSGAVIDATDKSPVPAGNVASCNFPTLGGGSRIDVPDSASLSITGSLSITAWVKSNLTFPSTDLQEIVGKWKSGDGGYRFTLNTGGGIQFTLYSAAGVPTGISGTNKFVTTGNWAHVAGTYDSTTGALHFYVDGAQSSDTGTASGPPADGTSALIIGLDSGNEFNGHIDEVRIYSRCLTPGEVGTLVTGVQPAPTGPLTATPGVGQIALSWTAAANATSYNIYRDTGSGFVLYDNVPGPSYTDTGVSNPNSYTYQVTAVGALESAPLGPASATPLPTPVSGPKVPGHESGNLAHRCGCSSIQDAGGVALSLFGLVALILINRRR
jgi:hypothetical protein